MKSPGFKFVATAAAIFASALSVRATSITYELAWNSVTKAGEFTYTVHNDTLSDPIEAFTIFFPEESVDPNIYTDLAFVDAPVGWAFDVLPEDDVLHKGGFATGYVDTGAAILPGQELGGFKVSFRYTDTDPLSSPGSQFFTIDDFNQNPVGLLDSGYTTRSTSIPDAGGTVACLTIAFAALAGAHRRNRSGTRLAGQGR